MAVRLGRTTIAWLLLAFLAPGLGAGAARAEKAAGDSAAVETAGLTYSFEATSSFHHVSSAYFGSPDWQPTDDAGKSRYSWGEGLTRARVGYRNPGGFSGVIGGVLLGTGGTDYFGTKDRGDGRVDQLYLAGEDVAGTGLGFTVGRQNLEIGDGFVIGDGFYDRRAALWNIPLAYSDAARLDWTRGPWSVSGFASLLSRSWHLQAEPGVTLYPKGTIFGAEVAYGASERRMLALAYFQREDTGDTEFKPRAGSLRAGLGHGPVTLSGEWVIERGTGRGSDLRAMAGHACLKYALPLKGDPYVEVEHLRFTGDDPQTPEDEAYDPWQYTWSDWSKWYVADLLGSTLVFNSDSRVWRVGCGVTPLENTTVRLLAHRIDLDTGSGWGYLPEGVGRGFADEIDLVIDQSIGAHWSAWVMGSYDLPREAGKALVGSARSGQIFASVTFKFAKPGGEE